MDEIKSVRLSDASGSRIARIREMMGSEEVFKNRKDRQRLSEISAIILADYKEAGFVNLVRENKSESFLFLDMVILEEYRNKGVGKKVFEILQSFGIYSLIFAAAKIDNIAANKTAEEVCIRVATIDDNNIYLVQKDRYDEFITHNYMSELYEHYEREKSKRLIK